jgi:hypothetical protein
MANHPESHPPLPMTGQASLSLAGARPVFSPIQEEPTQARSLPSFGTHRRGPAVSRFSLADKERGHYVGKIVPDGCGLFYGRLAEQTALVSGPLDSPATYQATAMGLSLSENSAAEISRGALSNVYRGYVAVANLLGASCCLVLAPLGRID